MSSVMSRGLSVALMCATFFAADATDNDTATCGGTANGAPCVFPFEYDGANYSQCTTVDDNQPWCITDDGIWGYCRCEGRRFAVGDRVRVKASVQTPMVGWGKIVTHQSIGVVTKVVDVNMGVHAGLFVDFPGQTNWLAGNVSEMEIVSKAPTAAPFLAPTPAPTEAVMVRSSACFLPINSLGSLQRVSWAECLYHCKQDSRCHGVSYSNESSTHHAVCGLTAIAADPNGDGPFLSVADPDSLIQMPCQIEKTWTAYDRRYELPPAAHVVVGAQIRVKEEFWSMNGQPERLHQGDIGLVLNIDPEGDAQIKFNAYSVQQWVHMSNFVLLEVVQAPSFSPQDLAEAQKHVEDLFKTLMSAASRDVTGLALAAALAVTMASVW